MKRYEFISDFFYLNHLNQITSVWKCGAKTRQRHECDMKTNKQTAKRVRPTMAMLNVGLLSTK